MAAGGAWPRGEHRRGGQSTADSRTTELVIRPCGE
jgi:hypothetical protein